LAAALLTTPLHPAAAAPAASADLPEPSAESVARTLLAALAVAAPRPMTGYSRERFPRWAAQGSGCDTRKIVLARDGRGVQRDTACRAVSGTWHSLYDDRTFGSRPCAAPGASTPAPRSTSNTTTR
jgi:hypothetical protein